MMELSRDSAKIPQGRLAQQYDWLKGYSAGIFSEDLVAAIIVTILLVPQALAYALLAGLPPQAGIYASIFPVSYTHLTLPTICSV